MSPAIYLLRSWIFFKRHGKKKGEKLLVKLSKPSKMQGSNKIIAKRRGRRTVQQNCIN